MIIYNVTTKVATGIAEEWLRWLLQEHAPSILETGCFSRFHVLRLLDQDESEGPTYVIQYHADSIEGYERYLSVFAPVLREETFSRWGNQFIAFRSVMEVIH